MWWGHCPMVYFKGSMVPQSWYFSTNPDLTWYGFQSWTDKAFVCHIQYRANQISSLPVEQVSNSQGFLFMQGASTGMCHRSAESHDVQLHSSKLDYSAVFCFSHDTVLSWSDKTAGIAAFKLQPPLLSMWKEFRLDLGSVGIHTWNLVRLQQGLLVSEPLYIKDH